MPRDPKDLLYGPRKQGPGPKNWIEETVIDLYDYIDEEADTQWKECAVKELCIELNMDRNDFFDQPPEWIDAMVQMQYGRSEFKQNNALLETHFPEGHDLKVFLTPMWSNEELIITQAHRRLEKEDKSKPWHLWGYMNTRDSREVKFADKGFKDLIREIDQESVLLDTLAYSRDIDELAAVFWL